VKNKSEFTPDKVTPTPPSVLPPDAVMEPLGSDAVTVEGVPTIWPYYANRVQAGAEGVRACGDGYCSSNNRGNHNDFSHSFFLCEVEPSINKVPQISQNVYYVKLTIQQGTRKNGSTYPARRITGC